MPRSAILTSARAVFRSYAAKCKALPRGAVRAWNSLFLHFSDQFRDVDDLPLAALITPEKPQAAQLRNTELARICASFVSEVENILGAGLNKQLNRSVSLIATSVAELMNEHWQLRDFCRAALEKYLTNPKGNTTYVWYDFEG